MTIGALLSWASGTWLGRAVAGALALLVAILAAWGLGRREGAQRARRDAAEGSLERQEKGREAVSDLRDADRDNLVDQLHRNTRKWK